MLDSLKKKKPTDMLLGIILLVLAIVFLLIAGVRLTGKTAGIVSADIDRIMGEHPAFQEAMLTFQTELKAMQENLDKLEGEAKLKEQQQMQQKVQQLAVRLQEEAAGKVMEDVRTAAKNRGYVYILDSKALIAGGKDVTEEILEELAGKMVGNLPEEEPPVLPMIPVR